MVSHDQDPRYGLTWMAGSLDACVVAFDDSFGLLLGVTGENPVYKILLGFLCAW